MNPPSQAAIAAAEAVSKRFEIQWPALTQLTGGPKSPSVEAIAKAIEEEWEKQGIRPPEN